MLWNRVVQHVMFVTALGLALALLGKVAANLPRKPLRWRSLEFHEWLAISYTVGNVAFLQAVSHSLYSIDVKRSLVETDDPVISIRRQCELLSLNRSTLYYQPAHESALNLRLMRLLDEQYMRTPFYGWPKMAALGKRLG